MCCFRSDISGVSFACCCDDVEAQRKPPAGKTIDDRHRERRGPRDPRQPGQSDRRSGCRAGRRLHGPRGGALGRIHRDPRGGRIARWGQGPLWRKGRAEGGRSGQSRHFRRSLRPRGGRPAQDRRDDDRSRRDREQIAARGQRDPRRVACGRKGGGGGVRAAALPLRRRHDRAPPADAADEYCQWRRPRRQSDRLPGIHDPAGRRAGLRRRRALGRRDFSRPQERAQEGGAQHQCRRRRRFCPQSSLCGSRPRILRQGDRGGGLQTWRGHGARSRLRSVGIFQGRRLRLFRRGKDPLDRRAGPISRQAR